MNEHFWHTAMIELHVYSSFSIRKNLSIDILDQTDCFYFNVKKFFIFFYCLLIFILDTIQQTCILIIKKKNRKNEEKKIFSSQKREIDRVDYL